MRDLADFSRLATILAVGAPVVPLLWERALTHRSVEGTESYERFEFLGDRVLALVIAEWLLERFPDAVEGELARRLAALAREDSLAEVAAAWKLADFLIVGESLRADGGMKTSVLADAVESLLAVIWREQGYDTVRALIRRSWGELIERVGDKDPKTALQEAVQAVGSSLPRYMVV
ncbi:MAG: ribonuclease III, partial [Alphaproteobacteria bacterium CG_4_10_14_0_8_um_filter_53_9]